jgi:hypothetical protein
MPGCNTTCNIEPFLAEVTMTDDISSVEVVVQDVQDYLERLRTAICADLNCIETDIAALDARITALENP